MIQTSLSFRSTCLNGPVVELHALAEVEGVLLAVRRDLVLPCEVGDDGLSVLRVAPQQRVVHRALGADVRHRAGLMDVEVRRRVVDGIAERPAALGRRVGTDRRRGLLGARGYGREPGGDDGGADPDGPEERAAADGRAVRATLL